MPCCQDMTGPISTGHRPEDAPEVVAHSQLSSVLPGQPAMPLSAPNAPFWSPCYSLKRTHAHGSIAGLHAVHSASATRAVYNKDLRLCQSGAGLLLLPYSCRPTARAIGAMSAI